MLTLLVGLLLASPTLHAQDAPGRHVAVVVGLGRYGHLPDGLAIPAARDEAWNLGRALQVGAGYDEVHVLIDDQATHDALEDLLFTSLPPRLGPKDTLLVYFSGLGLGGDFGEPYLLPYDTDPAKVPETALPAKDFVARLQKDTHAGAIVLLTDASHPGQLGGLALVGPTAKTWPEPPGPFFALSATSGQEIPASVTFGTRVIEALGGAADVSGDKRISAGELTRYVMDGVVKDSQDKVHPCEGGIYEPGLIVSEVKPPPPPPPPPSFWSTRRVVGVSSVGAAVLAGGGSWWFYRQGNSLKPVYFGTEPIEGPQSWAGVKKDYTLDYWLHTGLFVGAGVLAAAGGTLIVWPSAAGPSAAVQVRF